MNLTLRIRSTAPGMRAPDVSRQTFSEQGGTIGRAASNTWVLPDKKVSGRHALISCEDGVFYIQDMSSNGVAVNGPKLAKGRPYALREGDRILIEPYEIEATIDAGAARSRFGASPPVPGPLEPLAGLFPDAGDDPFAPVSEPLIEPSGPVPAPFSGGVVDPLAFFDPVGTPPPPRRPEPIVPPAEQLLAEHYRPPESDPAIVPQPSTGDSGPPPGWNPLSEDSSAGVKAPPIEPVRRPKLKERPPREPSTREPEVIAQPPVPVQALPAPAPEPVSSAPTGPGPSDLSQILASVGLPNAEVTPELAQSLGEILRVVVTGLMELLQSRQHIKGEFGLVQTMFRPKGNNPLKFSANAADALHNLLVKRNAAYLGPVDAFADAFDDLRDHQLAMLAGMRVAFQSMLKNFDPDRLQEEFDRQIARVSLPLIPAKLRYWDLYRDKRQEMAKDPEAAFDRLFGEEFARAYDEQFRELRAQRRARAAGDPKEPGEPPT